MSNDDHTSEYNSVENRLKRIETTLYLLCRHLGVDPRTGGRLAEIAPHTTHPPKAQR